MKGILGKKVGMTEVFTKDGKLIPVTVVEVEPNIVMQVKTKDRDGYNAIQLGVTDKKEKNATKANIGHAKKANTNPKRFLKEIRDVDGSYEVGSEVKVDIFTPGEIVDVTGTSKGKGFEGTIKRHNQSRGPMTHGSRYHRGVGSLGTMRPMRVMKGKNLPGHMGAETTTIQNLEIIDVNVEENYILVSGNIPGAKKSLVLIKSAVKAGKNNAPKELMDYASETVVDEVVEAPVENTSENVAEETAAQPNEETKEEVASETVQEEVEEKPATEETETEEEKVESSTETPATDESTEESK